MLPDENGQQVDRVLGVRYVDQLTRIKGVWRISHRRCLYEFYRMDPVLPGSSLVSDYRRGERGLNDPSYEVFGDAASARWANKL
jgi:hypothetical protein